MNQARLMYDSGDYTVKQIAATFSCSRPTIYRELEDTNAVSA